MFPRSATQRQEVNSRKADEVFAEDGVTNTRATATQMGGRQEAEQGRTVYGWCPNPILRISRLGFDSLRSEGANMPPREI